MRFCLCFLFFSCFCWVPFWLWVLGAVLLLFPSGFLCAFLFVFSLLFGLFWVPGDHGGREEEGQRLLTADWGLITAAGEAYDSGRGADYKGWRGL